MEVPEPRTVSLSGTEATFKVPERREAGRNLAGHRAEAYGRALALTCAACAAIA